MLWLLLPSSAAILPLATGAAVIADATAFLAAAAAATGAAVYKIVGYSLYEKNRMHTMYKNRVCTERMEVESAEVRLHK